MNTNEKTPTITEKPAWKLNGFLAIAIVLALLVLSILCIVSLIQYGGGIKVLYFIILVILDCIILSGIVIVQPNNSAVITFFGKYTGVIRHNGIWMVAPFSSSHKVSLRVRNFNSEKLKVNDTNGNPIEIAAVVVFKVVDSAKALFDVNNYEQFVQIQSETSLRHVAAQYPYDDFGSGAFSLRANADEVSKLLLEELQERLLQAGVEIMEARLTHLAYATEIASAMLQRQQASAILAARQIIVEGAVGMAQMALDKLETEGGFQLDEERKVNMINNIMVSIISDRSSQPVINVGSMY
jgi:regulator of protease activity HflC (stomatin/prohibitin superfamily)